MIRRAVQLIILLAVLLGAAGLAVDIVFPPARVQAIVEERVQERLHRAIRLRGLHLHLTGLVVDHLELSEEPNFNAGTFLIADNTRLIWSLVPLLRSMNWQTHVPGEVQGSLGVGTCTTPYYKASELRLDWNLHHVEPRGNQLTGAVTLDQGPGTVHADALIRSNNGPNLVLVPLRLLNSLNRLGAVSLSLPNLQNWPVERIQGDYRFGRGLMTIQAFKIIGQNMIMQAAGTVTLAGHDLALKVTLHASGPGGKAPLDATLTVGGTAEHPKINLDELRKKAFKATIQSLLDDPAKMRDAADRLKKLFQ